MEENVYQVSIEGLLLVNTSADVLISGVIAGGFGSATAPPKVLICHKLGQIPKIGKGHLSLISQKYPQFF